MLTSPVAQEPPIGLFPTVAPTHFFVLEQQVGLSKVNPIAQQEPIDEQSRAVDKDQPRIYISKDGSCCLKEVTANSSIYWFFYI